MNATPFLAQSKYSAAAHRSSGPHALRNYRKPTDLMPNGTCAASRIASAPSGSCAVADAMMAIFGYLRDDRAGNVR